jgi:hypothetical protein
MFPASDPKEKDIRRKLLQDGQKREQKLTFLAFTPLATRSLKWAARHRVQRSWSFPGSYEHTGYCWHPTHEERGG